MQMQKLHRACDDVYVRQGVYINFSTWFVLISGADPGQLPFSGAPRAGSRMLIIKLVAQELRRFGRRQILRQVSIGNTKLLWISGLIIAADVSSSLLYDICCRPALPSAIIDQCNTHSFSFPFLFLRPPSSVRIPKRLIGRFFFRRTTNDL